jgi:Fe-S cluster assembly scaffold protein SufB
MEQQTTEPKWLAEWRSRAQKESDNLPEPAVYDGGIKGLFSCAPNFEGEAPVYRVVHIEKELELYTLKEAYETIGINNLLEGLLSSTLLPASKLKAEALARASIGSGLLCYVQPKIDEVGNFVEQHVSLETTLQDKGASDMLIVIAKTGARVVITHHFEGGSATSMLWRTCIVVCEEGAEVRFVDEVEYGKGAVSIDRFGLVGGNAKIEWIENVSTPGLYRSHVMNMLAGSEGSGKVEHVLLAQREAQYDISVEAVLRGEGTESNIMAVGAVAPDAHIIYQGNSEASASAKLAVCKERAKFLLLDDSARVDVVPALLAGNSAAQVEHQMVVTHIRDEEVFTATSKGLDVSNARSLALLGFFADVKQSPELQEKLSSFAHSTNI